ncbi:MAG: bifunctional folylpolyglutamate synthase/dihydrofolate synthase [Egibacteraceae bacterium]
MSCCAGKAGVVAPADRYEAAVRTLFARRPDTMVRGLDRIRAVSERLGNPQHRFEAVHITGTNGKTTLARMISSVLQCAGLRVGTFTSPHLQDVRERVHVAGQPISAADLLAHLDALAPAMDRVERERGEMVTFFETMTALAFRHFAAENVDAAVLEVGVGGRLDPTNVARARIAVIGPIGLDHPELGPHVEDVAGEKAGIVKDGVRMVVSARQPAAAARVISRRAARLGVPVAVEGADFGVLGRTRLPDGQELDLAGLGRRLIAGVRLPLQGAHQAANAAVAVAASESFLASDGRLLQHDAVRAGFASTRSPGRLELVRRQDAAPVLLDGAHNPDGALALAGALRSEFPAFDQRVLVLGMQDDKDVEAVVRALLPAVDSLVVTCAPGHRAAPADRLAKAMHSAGRDALVTVDTREALACATELANPSRDLVVVTGSLYLVGAAREILGLTSFR